jgi:hypothetical protein
MKRRKVVILSAAGSVVVLGCLALAASQVTLGRSTQSVITADLTHFIAGASGPEGIQGAEWREESDLPLDTLIAVVAREAWRLARGDAGGEHPVSAVCVAALAPTGFFTPPPRTLEHLQLPGAHVIDPRRCAFTSFDNVSYRTVACLRRRAWLLWVGLPKEETGAAYSIETGFWAAGLYGASWRCRVQRGPNGYQVDSCTLRWIS